jgi:hypothetical protein
MATITPQILSSPAGFDALTWTAAGSTGDEVTNTTGKVLILAKNAHATVTRDLTITAQNKCNHDVLHDVTKTLPVDEAIQVAGPFPIRRFNNENNAVEVETDVETDVSLAAIAYPDA